MSPISNAVRIRPPSLIRRGSIATTPMSRCRPPAGRDWIRPFHFRTSSDSKRPPVRQGGSGRSRPPEGRGTPPPAPGPRIDRLVSATSGEGSDQRYELAEFVEKSAHFGSEDADRTAHPGHPTKREAIHGGLADVADPRDRRLQASLYCFDARGTVPRHWDTQSSGRSTPSSRGHTGTRRAALSRGSAMSVFAAWGRP